MSVAFDEFVLPEPWWDLRGHGHSEVEQRERLVRRLRAETGEAHPLAARSVEAVAAFTRQDEVLFRLDVGEEFLLAHLTFSSTVPDPDIRLRSFPTWTDAAAVVNEMAEEW